VGATTMNREHSFAKFIRILKEALFSYTFDICGVLAGFIISTQMNVFMLAPWTIAAYPAIVSMRGVVTGMMSGRLSTALHVGTVRPGLFGNTRLFYAIFESIEVITCELSIAMGLLAIIFGGLFLGVESSDFLSILIAIMATMSFGLIISVFNVIVCSVSFKKGLDPDIVTYPIMSSVADVVITLCYVLVLNMFFLWGATGKGIVFSLGTMLVVFAVYLLKRNFGDEEFMKTIKESLLTMVFVALIVNVTGTTLGKISEIVGANKKIYTIYPALIDTVGDVGAVVGSIVTTKFALGFIKPALSTVKGQVIEISAAWIASMIMFVFYSFLTLVLQGMFTIMNFIQLASLVIVVNVMAAGAIASFSRGLDPDNFVIPIESSLADTLTSVSLFTALILFT
jgi:mgtE-like transporter